MNELIIFAGGLWRVIDGRDFRPQKWNILLFVGLLILCMVQFAGMTSDFRFAETSVFGYMLNIELQSFKINGTIQGLVTAFAIYAITLISILSGYKSFTWPWVVYHLQMLYLWTDKDGHDAFPELISHIKEEYESPGGGYSSWHTSYRFLVPSIAICTLTSWNTEFLFASLAAGVYFPLSIWALDYMPKEHRNIYGEAFAWVREALVGFVLIGGLTLL
tara:strand:- start:14823 stop:15476 length:654 start_codon:yes stop_codon:yes gene_type:complete